MRLHVCDYVNAKRISQLGSIHQFHSTVVDGEQKQHAFSLSDCCVSIIIIYLCASEAVFERAASTRGCAPFQTLWCPYLQMMGEKKNTVASELSLFICFSTHNAMGFVCGNSQRMDECSKINIQTNWSPFWVWDVKRDRETTTKLFAYRKLATSAAKRSIYRIYEYRLIESTLKNFHLDRIVSPLCPSASVWSNENK